MKRVFLSVLSIVVVFVVLVGCSKSNDKKKKITDETYSAVKNSKESSTSESKKEEKKQEISESIPFEDKVASITESLKMGLSDFYTVKFVEKNKTFQLTSKENSPLNENLKKIASESLNDENKQSIEEMANSLVGFSEAIEESLDKGYKIEVINSYNNKGSFFILEDGKVSYPIKK